MLSPLDVLGAEFGAGIGAGIGNTPMSGLDLRYRGRRRRILVKHESANPSGSVKDRTAASLLLALHRAAPLTPGTVVVESTSGNLGLALARLLAPLGCRLVAVVDPAIPRPTDERLRAAGVDVRRVEAPDVRGGYLLRRLEAVRRIRATHPAYRWTDQYDHPANPRIHRDTTGPELVGQAGPGLDAVYVAVSTGGTLAGIAAYLRSTAPRVRIVAVDAEGSMATGAGGGRRLLSGIGAGRRSSFLTPGCYDKVVRVPDELAIAACRILIEDTGIRLGGSSGSVLSACVADLGAADPPRLPVCLSADDGHKYRDTVYDDGWLAANRLAEPVGGAVARLRGEGLRFSLEAG